MKTIKPFRVIVILLGIFLSACGAQTGPAASSTGGGKPQASEVAFTGVIESIDGDQWVVNGQTITVAASVINNGPFQAGDTVKVEARVEADGSVVVLRVETPSAADLANDNSNNSNSNDVNANDDNSVNSNANADNSNDVNSNNANGNNDNGNVNGGNEVFGTVDAITDTSITVGGQTYQFAPGAEIKGAIVAGDFVKIHLIVNADGTLAVREVGLSDPSQAGNDNGNNSNDDNGNDDNSNDDDDNGNSNNSNNDDDGNDDNSNGGNSNGG